MNDLITIPSATLPAEPRRKSFLQRWLDGQTSTQTRRAYSCHIKDFASFCQCDPDEAVEQLLSIALGQANQIGAAYKADLVKRGMAPNTVNARLTAVRKLTQDARKFGLIDWSLDVDNVRAKNYRDTAGPGRDGFKAMLAELMKRPDDQKRRRDKAILMLLFGLALRRNEVVSLDLEAFDQQRSKLRVVAKGCRDADYLSVPFTVAEAIGEWVDARGGEPGPLFINLDATDRGRLSGGGLWKMVVQLGRKAGVNPESGKNRARPHGMRHLAISTACEKTGGDMVAVQSFSRHSKLETVRIYVDNANDKQGAVADLVALD